MDSKGHLKYSSEIDSHRRIQLLAVVFSLKLTIIAIIVSDSRAYYEEVHVSSIHLFTGKRNGFVVIAFDFSLHTLIPPSAVHFKCVRTGSQQPYTSVLKSLKDFKSSFNNNESYQEQTTL